MAYGSAKGRIFRGDIYAEDDPDQDTYIDWGNDFISFGVGGVKVLNVSASDTLVQVLGNVSASLNITASGHVSASTAVYTHKLTASNFVSASTFYGDGQHLKNTTGTPGGFTTNVQFNDAGVLGGSNDFKWRHPGEVLIVSGTVSASGDFSGSNLHAHGYVSASAIYTHKLTASNFVSASTFYGDGQHLKNITTSPAGATKQIQFNEGGAFFADPSLQWSATPKFLIVSGTISASSTLKSKYVTASIHVSASAFYGDGQYLKNVGGGTGDGIFTTLASGGAYTTSSIRVGSQGEPSASLYVSASAAAAGKLFRLDTAGSGTVLFVTGNLGGDGGAMGIGTATPGATLDVLGQTLSDQLRLGHGGTYYYKMGRGNDGFFHIQGNQTNFTGYSFKDSTGNTFVNMLSDYDRLVVSGSLSASHNISASAFYGDGSHLTNLPGGGGIFTTLASGGAFTTSSIRVGSAGEPSASLYVSGTGAGAGPVFRVDSSVAGGRPLFFVTGSGRVGIGTDDPTRALEIEDPTSAAFQLNAVNARGAGAGKDNTYSFISDAYGFSIFDDTTGGTPGYRFNIADGGGTTTRGYVGIGNGAGVGASTFPTAQLHVSSSNGAAAFRVDGALANPALFVTGSGRVGIGTDAPEATLHISGSVAEAKLLVASDAKAIELYPANGPAMGFGTPADTDYYMKIGAFGGYNQIWLNNGSTDFQISGSTGGIGYYFDQPGGNIGIGTQSPAASLHVSSSRVDAVLRADGASGSVFVVSGSGHVALDGAGINGITGSLLGGYFTTTSSYGSRLSLKGNGVGDTPGTEPYIQPVSSSYIIPSGAFDSTPGAGFPPFPIPMKYETLAITAPSGKAQGGNILISGSGDLHLNFTNFSNSMGMPFTNTFGSTMNFGSVTTNIYATSSGMSSPWAIENPYGGFGGKPYAALNFVDGGEPGAWVFSHGDNAAGGVKYFIVNDLTASFKGPVEVLGNVSGAYNITASGHVSASAYYGDGQYLKNLPGGGAISTTTGGGNNTLYLPFVSSSTGTTATLFTDSAVALKPQSGSLILDGDGQVGVTGSLMGGYFTTTSSYGSRLSLKGAEVGDVAGTEPYIQVVSSSYIIPAGAFGGGQPPFDIPLKYETLEISAPNGHGRGAGNVQISGSGDLHLNFTNFSNSMGMPFTNTFGSTMEFGSLSTYLYTTSSKLVEPYGIFNGHDDGDGMPYASIQMPPDTDPGQWLFSHGENELKYFRVEELTASFDNIFLQANASASFQGGTSFFGGLEIHAVPLTSNVGAQIGGGSGNKFQVVVTSSFENIAMFAQPLIANADIYSNTNLTSNSNQLFISGAAGGGMVVNITSSNNNNSLFTGGGALLGHRGGGNADIRLFAGHSGQAGTISGSNLQLGDSAQIKGHVIAEGNLNTTGGNISGSGALMIGGNATVAGSTTLGTGPDNLTLNVNSVKTNAGDFTWLLRSGSLGTGSGPGRNGPAMFYITHSGGSSTDILKFNTIGNDVGVVFPRNFYPHQSNNVDMGNHSLAFRTVYATQFGSAANVKIDGVNASGGNFTLEMPNGADESLMIRDQAAGSNWMTFGTLAGAGYRVNISKPTYIGNDESAYPKITLDVHYTGSKSPVNLAAGSGGGEVIYFGTGSLTNVGGVHYLNSKGGWVPTNADATGSGLTGDGGHKQLLGIALGSSPSANGMLIKGFFNATGGVGYYMGDFQTGSAVYLQAQGAPGQGRMSGSAPTGAGQFVRVVGYATDTPHVIYFNPDSTYVELA